MEPMNQFTTRLADPSQPLEAPMLPTDPYMQDGALMQPNPDGSMDIIFSEPEEEELGPIEFDANLAEYLDPNELSAISTQLLEDIKNDLQSSSEWRESFAKGVELLGLKIENPGTDPSASGISKVYHPLLLEAVVRDQATAMAELLPAAGPVKTRNDAPDATEEDVLRAAALEKDLNYYLTVVDKDYYPDFDQMLFYRAFSGCTFRKVYMDPIKKRPVSRFLSGLDLIVSNDAISLNDCGRKTHRIMMRTSQVKRLQVAGHYRDVPLVAPSEAPDLAESAVKESQGLLPSPQNSKDQRHTIYESYVEWDLPGFHHVDENGERTGLPLPYRITVDKDSGVILEIRRNWKQNDPDFTEKKRFVKYGFIPGLGFYDYGYVQLLGNTTRTLTAIQRQLLDAGMLDNFPAGLIAANSAKQDTNQIRLAAGQFKEIDTNGMPIQQVVMPMPYKGPSAVLAGMQQQVAEDGQRLGNTPEITVGQGNQEAPVGTTMALIEQATKVMSASHKRAHVSQQEEFEIFLELFRENPEALSKYAKTPTRKWQVEQEIADISIVPASDPNTPSHMHRLMRANARFMMLQQTPGANVQLAAKMGLAALGDTPAEIEALVPPPAPPAPAPEPQPTPDAVLKAQVDLHKAKLKEKEAIVAAVVKTHESNTRLLAKQEEIKSKNQLEAIKVSQKHVSDVNKIKQNRKVKNNENTQSTNQES